MFVVIYKYNNSCELHSLETKSFRFIQDMKRDEDLTVLEYKKFDIQNPCPVGDKTDISKEV